MEPQGLSGALSGTQENLGDLQGLFFGSDGGLASGFNDDVVEGLADSTGFDGVVYEAVAGLLTDQLDNRVGPALTKYGAALTAAVGAANAVLAGEEHNAADIIAAMSQVDVPEAAGVEGIS